MASLLRAGEPLHAFGWGGVNRERFPIAAREAIDAVRLHGVSFWDALILRAARSAGCRCLYSETLNAGQAYDGVTVVDPFGPSA